MTSLSAQQGEERIDYDAFVGRRVHQLLWDQHMTQTAFGALVGMDQSNVAKRLRGKVGWTVDQLVRTAEILGTTVAYLVGETENPRPEDDPTTYGGDDSEEHPTDYGDDGSNISYLADYYRKISA